MDSDDIYELCQSSLQWAEELDYRGYDPYDGLNSPILDYFARNWFTRLMAIHGVNKAPVNLRPVLKVPKERNPKGMALFASAYLNLFELTNEAEFLTKAEALLEWLQKNQSDEFDLPGWGYNFDWQNGRKFFLPAYHPSIVVTVFCGRAFIRHYELVGDEHSLELAIEAAEFIRTHINTNTINNHKVYSYTPYDDFIVINANALAADYFNQLSRHVPDPSLAEHASELFGFICDAQVEAGAWYYAMPASESHLSHDNFHTGFVLESLHDYAKSQSGPEAVENSYEKGMEFYRNRLFDSNGAPRFESDQRYPYDIHASAQGVITFSQRGKSSDIQLAEGITRWAHENLWNEEGFFYRRMGRVLTDRTPYMRWSQAWMSCALSKLSLSYSEAD